MDLESKRNHAPSPLGTKPLPGRTLEKNQSPRGVTPSILLDQVNITIPYLWTQLPSDKREFRYLAVLKNARQFQDSLSLEHSQYYELCLCAHYATVGSFVPTDVDHQIRFKLWHPTLDLEQIFLMIDLIEESLFWNFKPVTARWVGEESSGGFLSGHHGEWFSVAVGAYGATRKKAPARAKQVFEWINQEIAREATIFLTFKNKCDGISLLKASAIIAHNLGDLQRVMALWNLVDDEPLRVAYENALSKKYMGGILVEAGELYKALMATENHRHLALRAARPLRQNPDFLLPIGPFFDDWGRVIARHPLLTEEEVACTAEILIDGWHKLKGAVGYARALRGIEENFPGGLSAVSKYLPSRIEKAWKTGEIRRQCSISQERFETQWNQMALKFVREFNPGT